MQYHLDEISRTVRRGAHAVLLLDRAGWHTTGQLNVPKNISLVFLLSERTRTSPFWASSRLGVRLSLFTSLPERTLSNFPCQLSGFLVISTGNFNGGA